VTWVYALPTWLFSLAALAVLSGGSVVAHWSLRRHGWRGFREHNDIVGFILTIVGAIYAVVLGFVAVVVWEQYEASRQNEQHEVNVLSALYDDAYALAPGARDELRREIFDYVRIVTDDEWPAMRQGRESASASTAARAIVDTVIRVQATAPDHASSQAFDLSHAFMDARRARLQDNRSGIPLLLWVALFGGALLTLGFGYLFGIENVRFHATASACVAAMIALILVLIARLDYPYRGDTGIPPTDWQAAAQTMTRPP
jgi:hypothetical protein